jgi:hypothetical protein
LQQPCPHRLHHRPHRVAVVVSGHCNQDIHLANVNQLADKLIRKYARFGQKLAPHEPGFNVSRFRRFQNLKHPSKRIAEAKL